MKDLDWTTFTTKISINSSNETLFSYWTSQEHLEKWFLRSAEFFNKGELKSKFSSISTYDTYIWKWHGSDDVAEGEVLETNEKDSLIFTFLGCKVRVEVATVANENMVILTQYDIATDAQSTMDYYVGCTRGWTFYLANLKSILEGGIDLRNKNDKLIDVINT